MNDELAYGWQFVGFIPKAVVSHNKVVGTDFGTSVHESRCLQQSGDVLPAAVADVNASSQVTFRNLYTGQALPYLSDAV